MVREVSSSVSAWSAAITVTRLILACAAVAVVMTGCATRQGAPVIERSPGAKPGPARPGVTARPAARQREGRPAFHMVRKGETLFSIALDYGLDYRELAQWNAIGDPSVIRVGQVLRLTPPTSTVTSAPFRTAPGVQGRPLGDTAAADAGIKTQPKAVHVPYSEQAYVQLASIKPEVAPRTESRAPPEREEGEGGITWAWPANGKVVGGFSDSGNLKGISIAGKLGQPVLASAPGRVIFSGTGIRGFGKLIVIKHNNTFLSVYAHNSELLVKEGQSVARGQKIAEMGSTDTDRVQLHFEIRRYGKPVDPIKLLPPA